MAIYNHYFEIRTVDLETVITFHTNASPPRVGDLVDLHHISDLVGDYKVIQVKHIYIEGQHDEEESPHLAMIEIIIKKAKPQKAALP
jgi:hypothetical protein